MLDDLRNGRIIIDNEYARLGDVHNGSVRIEWSGATTIYAEW
jgi:hypothetical protein